MMANAGLVLVLFAGVFVPANATADPLLIGEPCPWEDQSSGFGGQAGSCTFQCEFPALATLEVRADDGSATVSGQGKCSGEGLMSCSGKHTCNDQDDTSKEGPGVCSGESDEIWDSGLYIKCTSKLKDLDPGAIVPPIPPRWCPLTVMPYSEVCFDGDPMGLGASCMETTETSCSVVVEICDDGDSSGCVGPPPAACELDCPTLPGVPDAEGDDLVPGTPETRPPDAPGVPVVTLDPCKVVQENSKSRGDCSVGSVPDVPYLVDSNLTVPVPAAGMLDELAQFIEDNFDPNPTSSSAQIFATSGLVTGYVCKHGECVQVVPTCGPMVGSQRWTCSIP